MFVEITGLGLNKYRKNLLLTNCDTATFVYARDYCKNFNHPIGVLHKGLVLMSVVNHATSIFFNYLAVRSSMHG